ncbi:Bug family tripartite tricarboxylate transporter substrate binding protein [Piscinibacter koreensis]|uniref:Tripartite tricarboxylate transporter substrate binding protein n=1 Tax=Piscinibacter koreensis TaxID=2742824 RepID=A0A7Y6TVA0_9BURK|nr:tripartite tricarboxylate transporter substrate binding protein [Schlegelella koreensis]NUZ04731.1 tripartite tricarboxylate transporter substrate binding protein [Schlegelella koreensis]
MQRRSFIAASLIAACVSTPALAADRTIRIVVPYAPGGPTDAMARILQGPLQQALGATVLIENVPGAGGALGAQQVLRAPADGNTFFLGNNGPSAVTPLLQKAASFDPLKDFVPVSMIAKATMQLVVSSAVPANDMASFIAYARANPGKLNYASAGIGSLGHLGSELLAKQAGLQMTHVPYKGQAPTLNALLGNEVQVLLTTPTDAMRAHIASGRIKLIAVTSEEPSPLDPKADLVQRAVPGFVLYSWFALMAKAGTPEPALAPVQKALASALATDDVRRRFEGLGVAVDTGRPAAVTAYIRQDVTRWSAIIRERDIRAE